MSCVLSVCTCASLGGSGGLHWPPNGCGACSCLEGPPEASRGFLRLLECHGMHAWQAASNSNKHPHIVSPEDQA
eukprot:1286763-Pyramimonas_sp.AAC.1